MKTLTQIKIIGDQKMQLSQQMLDTTERQSKKLKIAHQKYRKSIHIDLISHWSSLLVESIRPTNTFTENNSNETDSESDDDLEISNSRCSSRFIEKNFCFFQLHLVYYRVNPYGNAKQSILPCPSNGNVFSHPNRMINRPAMIVIGRSSFHEIFNPQITEENYEWIMIHQSIKSIKPPIVSVHK